MANSAPKRDVSKAVSDSTTRVTMDDLNNKGVADLRVLSESKFLHLVNRLVEDAVGKRLENQESAESIPVTLDLADDQAPEDRMEELADDTNTEFHSRWNELREKHVQALENIEARLSHLGEAVVGMEGALGEDEKAAVDPAVTKRKELLHRALARRKSPPEQLD